MGLVIHDELIFDIGTQLYICIYDRTQTTSTQRKRGYICMNMYMYNISTLHVYKKVLTKLPFLWCILSRSVLASLLTCCALYALLVMRAKYIV